MTVKLSRIKQLRDEYSAFSNQSEAFTKHYKKLAEDEGIDWYLIVCTDTQFETVRKSGNLNEFIS